MAALAPSLAEHDRDAVTAALRADAAVAIAAVGQAAQTMVPIASLGVFGARLGWPGWLYGRSSLDGRTGPPPQQICVADDLLIAANLCGHMGAVALTEQSINSPQPATGSSARLALANAPTLGDVICYMQRAVRYSSPYCRPEASVIDGTAIFGLSGAVPLGGLLDYIGLLFGAAHVRVVADICFQETSRASIDLTMPDGPHGVAIRRLLGCTVRFGASANRVYLPADWLDLPNPGHDPQLWALACERLRAAEVQFLDNEEISRIRARIAEFLTLHRKAPRLKQVAQAENISTRSLVRHLADAGHSFHSLVDNERRLRAAQMINDPNLSIRAIAEQLGFPDVSSFGRKFRRWFGNSPARFRRDSD
jgi:AraC-like DNA-binding protein